MENLIVVTQTKENRAVLQYGEFIVEAFIGENGTTKNKTEGDKKTPLGEFELGICMGIHNRINKDFEFCKINNNKYWIDDSNSKYYNKLVDIKDVEKDWNSAEHLIDYKKQYEYAIEIKINPKNIHNKGSAIFLHCSIGKPTAGCVAIEKEKMIVLLSLINKKTRILIK